jgi:hypothetical protein
MAPPEALSGFDVVLRLTREADPPLSAVILISTHAEEGYADLIAAPGGRGSCPRLGCPLAPSVTFSGSRP